MEKNRLLDIKDKTRGLIPILIVLLLSSCALPRIIILNDPLSPEEHINLGVSYEKKGELDYALREYETASKRLDIAYLYIGNIYFYKKDFKKAEKFYKKAIKKTGSSEAYNNLAWLYYISSKDLNDKDERLEGLKKGLELASKAVEMSPQNENFIDTLDTIKNSLNKEEER